MSIIDSIGKTPLVELCRINPNPRVKLLAKLEGANPGGSIKDRIAHYMIAAAEAAGTLKPYHTILEPTSGNTGIGLAMVGAARGYRVKLVMPSCVSLERRKTLEALGAELVLSPGPEGTDGAIRLARGIFEQDRKSYFMPDQFNNEANVRAHYETTGPEVFEQTGGAVAAFVAGMGTTGTLMGVSMRLKEHDRSIRIIGCEPTKGHAIQGLKNMTEAIVPGIYDPSRLDAVLTVTDDEAFDTTRLLAVREGLFVGMSSGAAMAAALRQARAMNDGAVVVVLPDRGDRYLSTALFTSVCGKCPP